MLEELTVYALKITDPVLGWLLHIPRDLAVLCVALITGLLLTGVRKFTTNQDLLKRCKQDKTRLKQLIREAKKNGDKEAVGRYKLTINQIGMVGMKAEGLPLLVSLLPIALLATWCFSRIAYEPPQADSVVVVKAYFPVSAIGGSVHLVPQQGVKVDNGWIQVIRSDVVEDKVEEKSGESGSTRGEAKAATLDVKAPPVKVAAAADSAKPAAKADPAKAAPAKETKGPPRSDAPAAAAQGTAKVAQNGVAEWSVRCDGRTDPYKIEMRYKGRAYERNLVVDGIRYSDDVQKRYDEVGAPVEGIDFQFHEYKFLGFMPSIDALGLQSWILGYLLCVLPLAFLLKPALRIY